MLKPYFFLITLLFILYIVLTLIKNRGFGNTKFVLKRLKIKRVMLLDQKNKVVTFEEGANQYTVLLGQTNLLLDKQACEQLETKSNGQAFQKEVSKESVVLKENI